VNIYIQLNQASRHEDVKEDGGIAPLIFILVLDGDEWSVSVRSWFIWGKGPPLPTVQNIASPSFNTHCQEH